MPRMTAVRTSTMNAIPTIHHANTEVRIARNEKRPESPCLESAWQNHITSRLHVPSGLGLSLIAAYSPKDCHSTIACEMASRAFRIWEA